MLEVELDRNHFTRHGLHLNSEVKKLVSHKLALAVLNFPTKHHSATIPATRKDPPHIDTNPTTQILSTEEGTNSTANSSQHRRRYPARRNPDFFMVMNDRIPLNIKQTEVNNDLFKVYHQNVRSLRNKTQELLSHLHPNLPRVICLSDRHHLS